ncbi:MAG: hypothetical protein ACJAWV_003620 [Flammeovirgaceae bacterium]|jgi:hypothetical protein
MALPPIGKLVSWAKQLGTRKNKNRKYRFRIVKAERLESDYILKVNNMLNFVVVFDKKSKIRLNYPFYVHESLVL